MVVIAPANLSVCLLVNSSEAVAKAAPHEWVFPIAQRRPPASIIVAWRTGSLHSALKANYEGCRQYRRVAKHAGGVHYVVNRLPIGP
jgi:hypothetical protein